MLLSQKYAAWSMDNPPPALGGARAGQHEPQPRGLPAGEFWPGPGAPRRSRFRTQPSGPIQRAVSAGGSASVSLAAGAGSRAEGQIPSAGGVGVSADETQVLKSRPSYLGTAEPPEPDAYVDGLSESAAHYSYEYYSSDSQTNGR